MIESKIREQSQMLEARNARKIEHQHELKSKMKRKEHHKKNKARISLRNVSEENEELVNNDHERKSVVRITIYPKRYYEEKAKKKEEEQKIELKPIDLEKGLSEKQKRTLQYFIDQGIPAASITIDTKKDKFYSNGKRLF
ncbi:MAG: hypothetical protein NT001_04815 [Candidatus Woesearchaeota archaeon]|nr:hypothetical protein [Candidatus Woesearchaeota archaeon]